MRAFSVICTDNTNCFKNEKRNREGKKKQEMDANAKNTKRYK